MKFVLSLFFQLIIVALLTILTQIGGLVWILTHLLIFFKTNLLKVRQSKLLQFFLLFSINYLLFTFVVIPPMAQLNNRVPLPILQHKDIPLKPANWITCFLNRHYVRPDLYDLIKESALQINKKHPGTIVIYLDANFPFFNGFPLLPHLSHNDGKKLDISFLYTNKKDNSYYNNRLSFLGYGYCEPPQNGEVNYPSICSEKGYWQYSLLEKIVDQDQHPNLFFDSKRNKDLLQIIAQNKKTGKILIEPHLKNRLQLNRLNKIRFHGCHAVRHDDHIHIQL